jgi:phosphoribosylformylglycinamidine (FGAM) synthase PurS component
MRLKDVTRSAATERVKAMCDRLLANKVIEDYRLEVDEEGR